MPNALANNIDLYAGKYVALRSFLDKEVTCSGDNFAQVYTDAKKAGVESPVVFFVPDHPCVY